jgi:HAD superfamily hydrolase (TIGR01490 family)
MPARVAAFFDVDRTLLDGNSGALWLKYLRQRNEISRAEALRVASWIALYHLSLLDMERAAAAAMMWMRGGSEDELRDKCRLWFAAEVVPRIVPEARRRVAAHRSRGELCVILSSTTPYVAEPLAVELGVDEILCTRLEVVAGRFSGQVVGPVCYGAGKVHWAERLARERSLDLENSSFYSDSYSDSPMLERVGYPRVVNPDPRLAFHAWRRGWPMEWWRFEEDGSAQAVAGGSCG